MAVAFDAATESHRAGSAGDPHTFSHTPTGTPRGVVLFDLNTAASTIVTGVTYGGVSMGSPVITASDTAGEPSFAQVWFLGSSIPTGTQTVSVDFSANDTRVHHFVVATLTAGADTEVIDSDSLSDNQADPRVTLTYGGRTAISLCGLISGRNTLTDISDLGTMTRLADDQVTGGITSFVSRQTTVGSSDFTIGYTVVSDDVAFVALAVSQVAANVTATPGVLSLTTSGKVPTVTTTSNQRVTPSTKALTLATFAPTVSAPRLVTPDVASLSLTTFAPDVTAGTSNNKTATPDTASLTTTGLAPTVTASDHKTATPSTKALSLSTFAPTVTATANVVATPDTATLSLSGLAPTVTGDAVQSILDVVGAAVRRERQQRQRPGVSALPIPVAASPTAAHLSLTTHPPIVSVNDDDLVLALL